MKIYVASSWRNNHYTLVVARLRHAGHKVNDFRASGNSFSWDQVDRDWKGWSIRSFVSALKDPLARDGYQKDMRALREADAVVLVLPCGRSAHLEAGYAAGGEKPVLIYLAENIEAELMYGMAVLVTDDLTRIEDWLRRARLVCHGGGRCVCWEVQP